MYHVKSNNMQLINNNENGRIYIKKFEIEKLTYLFVLANFEFINCYLVKHEDNNIILYIKNLEEVEYEQLKEVQEKTLEFLENNVGIYINRIDVEIK